MPYSSEATQFLDRLTLPATDARATLYAALIDALVSASVWTKLDALYVFAAHDEWAARTNLINRNFDLENQGAPAFNLDHSGYTGPANTAKFLNTQFFTAGANAIAGSLYARNDASMGAFLTAGPAAGTDTGNVMGHFAAGATASLDPQYSDNKYYWLANHGGAYADVATPASTGMFSYSRTGANAVVAYLNGAQIDTDATASAALPEQAIHILRADTASAIASVKISAAFIGKALSAAEQLALYNALNTYFTAVNAAAGAAVPVVVGPTSSTVVDDTKFNGTPGLTKLASGLLFACYQQCTSEGFGDGIIRYKTSADNGATWSAATTIYTAPALSTAADVEVMQHSSGIIIVSVGRYVTASQSNSKAIVLRGASDLSSWSAAITVCETGGAEFTANAYTTSKAIELANGYLVLPVYGILQGDVTGKDSAAVMKSTDVGLTWGSLAVAAQSTANEQYNEMCGVLIGTRLVMLVRNDISSVETGYSRTYSDDSGATWSAPVRVIRSGSPSRPAIFSISGNRLLMWGRFMSVCSTRWGVSSDAGVSWSPFTPFDSSATDIHFYASSTLISSTVIGSTVALRRSLTNCDILYQDFNYDPNGAWPEPEPEPESDPVVVPSIATTPDDPGRKGPKKKRQKRPLDVQGTTEGLWAGRHAYRTFIDRRPQVKQEALPVPQPKEAVAPISGKTLLEMSQKLVRPDDDEQDMEILRRMGAFD